jgi:hypothetical protein
VPIDVRDLSDWQMVRMLATENATQRGTTAAACLDAVAAISRVVARQCFAGDAGLLSKIFETSITAAEVMWGNVRAGKGPGEGCIIALTPAGALTTGQIRIALDSGHMASIIATASGANDTAVDATFDANCAHLFRLDYHLAEFRRIVTGDVVRSYLPVDGQAAFARQIIADVGEQELTAIKLRERANVIFYEQLGMPRGAMRASSLRGTTASARFGCDCCDLQDAGP